MDSRRNEIKVVRVIARLNIGGPSIHAILLSHSLNKKGCEDILVCGKISESEGDMMYLAREQNVDPILIPELGRDIHLKNDLKSFFKLLKLMRKERPDIVHTHAAKGGALGRLAAFSAGVPVRIHTFHGHIFDGYFSPAKAAIFLLIERFLAIFTDMIVTVSQSVKDEIVDKLKVTRGDKCVVIPLGFDLGPFLGCEKLRGGFRGGLDLDDETVLVGIVGRLVAIKNHRMFLDAAKNIMDRNSSIKVKFIIIGDGELNGALRDYAKGLGLDDHVIFTGWRHDLPAVYSDLDIVALTSLNEGTPVSIIEAMASARPVISTNVGGVRDIIIENENGLLSGSNDVKDYSDKLFRLLENKEMRLKLGLRGREFARSRFNKDRLVNDIKNLYEECLRKKVRKKGQGV